MAIQWLLSDEDITSVLVGVRSPEQLKENLKALSLPALTKGELKRIDKITNYR